MRTAGFVLVGGRSLRMGQDKALLPWRDRTLVESIAAKVHAAAGNVALVGRLSFDNLPNLECIPDLREGLGPLSGIATALASGRGDLNLIVACDQPLLETEWLKLLLETGATRGSKCLVAKDTAGQVHPLCGVYRWDCLRVIEDALERGQLTLMKMLDELGAESMPVPAPIWNVNTPEEWRLCQELANGG